MIGPLDMDRPASGRTHEFRLVDGQLRVLSPGGRWQSYIPFRELREQLGLIKPPSQKAIDGQRRRYQAWIAKNKDHVRAYRKKWAANHPECERRYTHVKYMRMRTDPRRLALLKARQERYRAKKNALARQHYRSNLEQMRTRNRLNAARYYAKRPREGTRCCRVCGQPGHNVRRCPERTNEEVTDGHAADQHEQPPGRDLEAADG